jgi:serine protease Do
MTLPGGAATTATARTQDVASAPVVRAMQLLGHGARIGVSVHDVESDAAKSAAGVIVDEVRSGSPAEKAGIKTGDTIVEFDGERVRSVRQFTRLVQETPVGRGVSTVVVRNGSRVTMTVTPERSSALRPAEEFDFDDFADGVRSWAYRVPPTPPAPARPPEAPRPPRPPDFDFDFGFFTRGGRLGLSVESLTPQLSEYFGVKEGVLVRSVVDGSSAAKAGLKAGDVITAVNGAGVNDTSDVSRAIARLDEGDEFSLEIVRDKKTQTLKGKVEPRADRTRTRTIV